MKFALLTTGYGWNGPIDDAWKGFGGVIGFTDLFDKGIHVSNAGQKKPEEMNYSMFDGTVALIENDMANYVHIPEIKKHADKVVIWSGIPHEGYVNWWHVTTHIQAKKAFDMVDAIGCMDTNQIPWHKRFTDTKIFHMPLPCNTEALKSIKENKTNTMMVGRCLWYNYEWHKRNFINDLMLFKSISKIFDIQGETTHTPGWNNNENMTIKDVYKHIEELGVDKSKIKVYPSLAWHWDWHHFLAKQKIATFLPTIMLAGRMSCEAACVETPLISSKHLETQKRIFPKLAVNWWDLDRAHKLAERLLVDDKFCNEVVDYAKEAVEFYNVENCKKRILEGISES